MKEEIRVALIGLDTSHSVEFPRRMQAPDCPEQLRVEGLRAVSCLRFETPFTNKQVLDERQKQLEAWGIRVTEDFDEAVADCDAIMLEINDPAYHLEYFKKCTGLNKPIFIDKPLADNYENGKAIYDMAKENGIKVISSSALRFSQNLVDACNKVERPTNMYCYGPLGIPPVGSGIIWYGVHCFEMLERAMGLGAVSVDVKKDNAGAVAVVEYPDKRRGIVELTVGAYTYGGTLRAENNNVSYIVDNFMFYTEELREVCQFFRTGEASFSLDDALEVMNLLDAADKSYETGRPVKLKR
ncbi:MAG: Gfo/Idh/MocA family oxidoreductase [Clostridiales bacterium]|jgi:predicted dehydrogenase|nr:Gfo/Idh/MocA family oxidoreductase [Clostridiales bacterium]